MFRLKPSEFLSQNEITAATLAHVETFNPQDQSRVSWPNTAVVGRAYLDQLGRTRALPTDRANAVRTALDRADSLAPKSARGAESASQLDTLATQLEPTAAAANGADRKRLNALIALMKARAAALR
ncbi:MAG: hypothetical protein QM736_20470 [Vicinamibacterales bacterium]